MMFGLVVVQFAVVVVGVLLAWFMGRWKLGFTWASLGWGTLAFPLSQVARMALVVPLQLVFSRVMDPATATAATVILMVATSGLFEETTRWIVLRYWAKNTRSWRDGVGFGLGHGGIEALLLFSSALATNIMLLTNGEMLRMQVAQTGDATAIDAFDQQMDALQNMGLGLLAAGWYERVLAITAHVVFTLIVLRAVRERRWQLWLLAVTAHIVFNAVTVISAPYGLGVMYALLTAFTAVGLWAVMAGPLKKEALA